MQTCEFRRSYVGRYMHEYGGQTRRSQVLESHQNSKGTNVTTYGLQCTLDICNILSSLPMMYIRKTGHDYNIMRQEGTI
jgi:hypothetical protein